MTRPDAGLPALPGLLVELAELAAPADLGEVAELTRRLERGVFRVLVAGEANRGKSTLVNALLGCSVLPTGVVPLTAVPTTVAYGEVDRVEVEYLGGGIEARDLNALAELVTEAGNPHNRRGVAAVIVRLPAPLLANGLELVDTPGTGSVHEHNTAAAVGALNRMDAAVLVLSADPPISAAERTLLGQLRAGAVAVFCVLNKTDHLTAAELGQTRGFTEQILAAETGRPVPVWPVSARSALAARQAGDHRGVHGSGLGAFEAAFTRYLTDRQDTELARSVANRAARIATATGEEAAAGLAAIAISGEDLQARLAVFTDRLEQVRAGRTESAALAAAAFDRLLTDTNQQARALTRSTIGPLQHAVAEHLAGLSGPLPAVERQALGFAADRIRLVVDDWRDQHTAELDTAVQALETRLTARLDEHISAVRSTAATLFDLQLPALAGTGRLAGSVRFAYAFTPDPGQTEALAAAVRTRLPGGLGRYRVASHVAERAGQLLDRQIGRARADFQARLTETRRRLLTELDHRFDAGAGRIAVAVRHTAALRSDRTSADGPARAGLQNRRDAAQQLAAQLIAHTQPQLAEPASR